MARSNLQEAEAQKFASDSESLSRNGSIKNESVPAALFLGIKEFGSIQSISKLALSGKSNLFKSTSKGEQWHRLGRSEMIPARNN